MVRIILALSSLVLVCVVASGCLLKQIPAVNSQLNKYEQFRQQQVEKAIEDDENYKKLAVLCDHIGSFQKFELLRREMSVHGAPAVYYYYRSSVPVSDASRTIAGFMEQNGWHSVENWSMNPSLAFQKDELRVIIQYGGMGDADYGITCKIASESSR